MDSDQEVVNKELSLFRMQGGGASQDQLTVNPALTVLTWPFRSLKFEFAQHSPTTRPSVERTADKAFLHTHARDFGVADGGDGGAEGWRKAGLLKSCR